MRRIAIVLLGALALASAAVTPSAAVLVTITYTADNIVGTWYQNGGAPVPHAPGPNAGNWQVADQAVLNLGYGSYQIIFRVQNLGTYSAGNPAALLVGMTGGSEVTGDLLSSTSWEWAHTAGVGSPDPGDFNALSWSAATSWGTNGGANIWTTGHGGPIAGISTSAHWIWNEYNFAQGQDPELYLRGQLNVVPEPGTLGLLGLVVGGGLLWSRRRRR